MLSYLKGRLEFQTNLEDSMCSQKYQKSVSNVYVYRGSQRAENGLFRRARNESTRVARFKFLFVRENRTDLVPFKRIEKFLKSITRCREYKLRLYLLRGISLASTVESTEPKTFLRCSLNGQ